MISRPDTALTDFTSNLKGYLSQGQCSSTETQSMRQRPDRTGAQRAVSGKDMVAIYQNSPAYGFNISFFVSSITTPL